ncbi:hypothetical protein BGZ63DRAFT_139644 [Mariannaea sp. PMI_226]|nr:hypothetical protein BGZ63DRAFT_139644 [Mariannaea sp. PMI_226]
MVTFWPWRGDSSSTASFEKTLSTLSTKIADTQGGLDRARANSRRTRVLWTLYLSFAYLVYTVVLLLVVGYKNLGAYEWIGLTGGPLLIYTTRTTLAAIYNFRIESLSARLKEYHEERAKTIQKLKDATKYDSTLELIEKYGGQEVKSKGKKKNSVDTDTPSGNSQDKGSDGGAKQGTPGRTGMPPPPTANIQRRDIAPDSIVPGAEFAPNAEFTSSNLPNSQLEHPVTLPPTGYAQYNIADSEPHWYDRIFDVLLGEDETAPKNRIVLICQNCRLVNGQAPPGTKSLSELGTWKCMSCGVLNGELDEGKRIIKEVLDQAAEDATTKQEDEGSTEDDVVDVAKEVLTEDLLKDADEGPAAGVRRRRGKGKK